METLEQANPEYLDLMEYNSLEDISALTKYMDLAVNLTLEKYNSLDDIHALVEHIDLAEYLAMMEYNAQMEYDQSL